MDITPLIPKGKKIITNYSNKSFTIENARHETSIIVTPRECVLWGAYDMAALSPEQLQLLKDLCNGSEMVIIGYGMEYKVISSELKKLIKESLQISNIEWMLTGAACRTYNVLLSEERHVTVALINS